ncbi:MAG: S8 family serine peptidase [Gammaproteobacteria bacterium]|nr:S8 family serine peptidase [Gammaproteobacteria bacterium]
MEARALHDSQNRILVNVWLDGNRALGEVHKSLAVLGANVQAELASYRKGVIAAYLPIERASDVARLAGVRSVTLQHKPQLRLGKATSQGVAAVHADKLNAIGLRGKGITIGLMSDSFNKNPTASTHAAQDIKSGDLPGPGNPFGDTTPIVVVDEDPAPGTDEGRALMQIVYDIAPDAKQCFATAFTGEVQFAANILKLADPKGKCRANVIDDDVGYSEEPFFSDGVIALAVDQVKADGVAYFSSAGNDNSGNYSATFDPISDGEARANANINGGLTLGNVPTELTMGGWHNFGTAKNPQIFIPIFAPAEGGPFNHFLDLQWDDPFFDTTPSASYDFLVFDENGFYHPELSGIDNVYSTGQPVQGIVLPSGSTGLVWFVAITLRGPGFSTPHAMHLKWVDFDDGAQVTLLQFANRLAPAVFGHPAAAGAIAVAADYWNNTQSSEYFSSLGPVAIYFDQDNVRLATAEIRKKPEIAAPDGVDTTFFGGQGAVTDPNPVFFGTSAAAPHAAAVGALLIEAAGGPGSLSPDALKALLKETTQQPHQLIPGAVSATLVSGTDKLTVHVRGFLPLDPKQFLFEFSGPPGDSVKSIVLDASPDDISFGDQHDQFLIGPTNVPTEDIVYVNASGLNPVATLEFLNKGFTNNRFVELGFDFDNTQLQFGGINAGLLFGTKVTATIQSGSTTKKVSGVLGGPTGRSYAPNDGFGLIDAFAAYEKLKSGTAVR